MLSPHRLGWIACVFLLAAPACAAPMVRVERDVADGHELVIVQIPDSRITAFEYRVRVEAPPWRLWNAAHDVEGMFQLTSDYRLLGEPSLAGPRSINMIVEGDPVWFAPSFTATVVASLLEEQLGWENKCAGGPFRECYLRFTIMPAANGHASIVKCKGYFLRPWFVSHGRLAEVLAKNFKSAGAGIGQKVRDEKYAQTDHRFPWEEMHALAATDPVASKPVSDGVEGTKIRLAVVPFLSFPSGETTDTVASLATAYLVSKLAETGRYEVVSPDDINLIARYRGEHWALLCDEDESCDMRTARMVEAPWLLRGELYAAGNRYTLRLRLLQKDDGAVLWQQVRDGVSDLKQVQLALEEASRVLALREMGRPP